jgi:hypothetical protein
MKTAWKLKRDIKLKLSLLQLAVIEAECRDKAKSDRLLS